MAHELRMQCETGSPSVFLLAAAYLDYLPKLVNGADKKRVGYIEFIRTWLAAEREEYKTFRYKNGEQDLPDQMYHVLRCGIVHSFSFVPDQQGRESGARTRSIVIAHRKECIAKNLLHLSSYSTDAIKDAAVFVAEDFTEDIEKVTIRVFKRADVDARLRGNIGRWLAAHPPISGGY